MYLLKKQGDSQVQGPGLRKLSYMSQPLTQGALCSGETTKTSINTTVWEIHCQRRMHFIAKRARVEDS